MNPKAFDETFTFDVNESPSIETAMYAIIDITTNQIINEALAFYNVCQ